MMTKSLLRCRACLLTWFPKEGAGAACPACGGTKLGATFELFHVGIALIALGLIGWGIRLGPFGERPVATVPAAVQAKELTADVKRGPTRGESARFRRGDEVTALKRKDRRFLVKDRRGNQFYVSSNKVKRRQKAKKRSQHVQR